jgi:hypothetical protein
LWVQINDLEIIKNEIIDVILAIYVWWINYKFYFSQW